MVMGVVGARARSPPRHRPPSHTGCPVPLSGADGPNKSTANCLACYQLALQQLAAEPHPDLQLVPQVRAGRVPRQRTASSAS